MNNSQLRVGVIHRHRLLRESLVWCLAQQPHISVVCESSVQDTDYRDLCQYDPHFVLLEWDGVEGRCVTLARQILTISPQIKIVMMGVPNTEAAIMSCIETAGAAAYLLEDPSLEDVLGTVGALIRGETVCSPRIAQLLFSRVSELARHEGVPRHDDEAGLTPREREIIGLIERGLCNKEIAVHLCIEVQTVKNHVHNILDKLQLQDRQAAARYARERGLVSKGG